ncbi:hypothetical protein [Aurantimonas sp. Leaf443]|uniref:hypothetical protein n=1 Tax=Aurantimonas sp. Leaf443 TaxID=1736378 RepID=UPI00070139CA|nr:hypothetical protein [Aurantimonas sp. Leaf443]KQT86313.1 hypothetical protein ASG48_07095 [Aurantimonas sp. Leaf443]
MDLDRGQPPAHLIYVRDMLEQLKVVSRAEPGSVLRYLLDMTHLEVVNQIADRPADRPADRSEAGDEGRPEASSPAKAR